MKTKLFFALACSFSSLVFAEANNTVSLQLGESVALGAGHQLTLVDLIDSRCPQTVLCITEGAVELTLEVSGEGETFSQHHVYFHPSNQTPVRLSGGFAIEIVDAQPYPEEPGHAADTVTMVVSHPQKNNCRPLLRRYCTMDYKPARCQLASFVSTGSNECVARGQLIYDACLAGEELSYEEASCELVLR